MNYCIMKARKQQQQRVREEEAKGAEDNKRAGEVVREGVKGVLPLQLLSGEPMYEPEIQEHGMMTEVCQTPPIPGMERILLIVYLKYLFVMQAISSPRVRPLVTTCSCVKTSLAGLAA